VQSLSLEQKQSAQFLKPAAKQSALISRNCSEICHGQKTTVVSVSVDEHEALIPWPCPSGFRVRGRAGPGIRHEGHSDHPNRQQGRQRLQHGGAERWEDCRGRGFEQREQPRLRAGALQNSPRLSNRLDCHQRTREAFFFRFVPPPLLSFARFAELPLPFPMQ